MRVRSLQCLLLLGLALCDGTFLRGARHSLGGKVDVLFSSDKRMMVGLRTAVFSTVNASKDPERLRLHIAVDHHEIDAFRETFGLRRNQTKRALRGGASLEIHLLDVKGMRALYQDWRVESSTGTLRADGPSNYARFFIDDCLPADAVQAVWLDADVLVQGDVADLADTIMRHPSKTVAFAQYPGVRQGFRGNYSILSDVTNRSWAMGNLGPSILRHPVWNIGVLGFNMQHMREHHVRDRALKWIKLARDVALGTHGGSQMPFDLAALVHPDELEEPYIEVDPLWNCWWGFLGSLRTDKELGACKVLHFAGSDKPWNAKSDEHISDAAYQRWATAEKASRSFFG